MKEVITNYNVYDLEQTLVASGYAMIEEYSEKTVKKEALNSIDAYKQIVLDLETKIENLTSEKEYYENKWRTLKDIFADLTN